MTIHQPSSEAAATGLSGNDVYQYSAIIYHSEINRDMSAVRLYREALVIFLDSFAVRYRHNIVAENDEIDQYIIWRIYY